MAVGLALIVQACGFGVGETAQPNASASDAAVGAAGAATSVESARDAVVRIVAEGSFVDPEFGEQLNAAGSGSGYIIDPSGVAVTNNHVVTGAALLQVYVEGEDDPRNARVLGVSECSDLAVIDIDGEDLPFLEYSDAVPSVGLEVYTAGFPLGDPEFTLTRGIISKESAGGESSWASVDAVIEHDATINPGNSGGPLVTEDGRVVGTNYAGSSDSDQYFAIATEESSSIVQQLRDGLDVTSIGINGEAVLDPDQGLSGIWVASVASGSPAANAGVKGGDIITRLEGLILATDGTMADYCDILRSHASEDVLSIEVLRFATGEVLEGELNGTPLEPSFSFGAELSGDVAAETGGGGDLTTYTHYTTVSDDTGTISVDVPAEWVDADGQENPEFGPSIYAAPDLTGFLETYDVPGVVIEYSPQLGPGDIATVLNELTLPACVSTGRDVYEDVLYAGEFEFFTGCDGTDTAALIVAAAPSDGSFVVRVFIQIVEDRDLDAMDEILNSFVVH